MKVLVVDDSATVRDRLVEILLALDGVQQVDTASRAVEARHAIQSERPDVVVLDIHMPGGSGIEVLDALRADRRRVLTIVLTNDPAPEWRAASMSAGADFFFDKSVEFQQAIDVIARLALGRGAPGLRLPECWTSFQRLPIPTWICDVDTLEFKAVNDAAVARYGYSRDEFLGMTLTDIQSPRTVGELSESIGRRCAGETVSSITARQHRAKDGTPIYVDLSLLAFDRDGHRLDLSIAHDVSDRIMMEEALRASGSHRDPVQNAAPAPTATQRAVRGTESILLVEDEDGVREFAKYVLAAGGYEVLVASSPEEARRLCEAHPRGVDLLLTDYIMPGMTGRELAATLRGRQDKMKVIYMSGYMSDIVNEEDPGGRSLPFIGKPFTASVLKTKIREVLDDI